MRTLLLLLPWLSFGQEYAPYFRQANSHYTEGKFAESAAEYKVLTANYPHDPRVRYNLGNAYFKLDKPGQAIAEYSRAFSIWPRDADIRGNLDFSLRKAGGTLFPPDVPRPLALTFHWLSLRELESLQWLMYWIAALLASSYVLWAGKRRPLAAWLAASVCLWAFFAAWWGARAAVAPSNPGVTTTRNVEVRNGPGENFSVGFTAPEGRLVEIFQEQDAWLEIGVLKEGFRGWAPKTDIEKIQGTLLSY